MVDVLFGDVRVVKGQFLFEAARCGIKLHGENFAADNAFEPMQCDAGAEPIKRVRPRRAFAQADGVVIAVGVTKPQHHATGDLGTHGIDQLLPDQAHGHRAQNHHPLLVESDNPQVGSEVQHLSKLEVLEREGVRLGCSFHICLHLHSSDNGPRSSDVAGQP